MNSPGNFSCGKEARKGRFPLIIDLDPSHEEMDGRSNQKGPLPKRELGPP